jgi:hypothetical protein
MAGAICHHPKTSTVAFARGLLLYFIEMVQPMDSDQSFAVLDYFSVQLIE